MILTAVLENPFDLLAPLFAQRALASVVLLAVAAAAVGWIVVLADLPFFTHSVGAGAYPVLVGGALLGVSVALSALVGALVFAFVFALLTRRSASRGDAGRRDAVIGLVVVAAFAVGSVLASGSGSARLSVSPEALLFGSLLTIDASVLVMLGVCVVSVVLLALAFGPRWLADGFDPGNESGTTAWWTLLLAVALATGAALPVAGSLLAGALIVVPAATVRMFVTRTWQLPLWTLVLALFEGAVGLYLSLNFDLPTGASIAAVAGTFFFLAAALRQSTNAARGRAPLAVGALLVMTFALTGCGGSSAGDSESAGVLKVVATTPQVADIVRQVGGESVDVTTLLPPGADPHDYEPKPSAVRALSEAGIVFRSGGDIDAWLVPAMKAAGGSATEVDLSRSVVLLPSDGEHSDEHDDSDAGEHTNSHWYLDPANVARAAQRTRDSLINIEAGAKETFRANTNAYLGEIDETQAQLTRCVSDLPSSSRKLASDHDDFAYLAQAIDFEIVARLAATGESEPSASQLAEATSDAREGGAKALVASKGEVSKLEEQVAEKLDIPLLQLYSDNLTTGDDASTVLGAIEYDTARIVDAVGGSGANCSTTKR
jgi:zinc/manganese transport system substrate-binding protein